MQYATVPVFLFTACVVALGVGLLLISGLFNPDRSGRVTRMPYESGMDPIHDTRRRFDVRFHLLAIAFLVFDVELLFLYPWAVATGGQRLGAGGGTEERTTRNEELPVQHSAVSNQHSSAPHPTHPAPLTGIDAAVAEGLVESRHFVFAGVMVFLLLLTLGFVYDWRMGVFRWQQPH